MRNFGVSTVDALGPLPSVAGVRGFRFIAAMTVLVLFLGLHWTVLQTVAWTRMLLEYSQSAPLGVALAMTFDGKHPCTICRAVEEGRRQERNQDPTTASDSLRLECDLPAAAVTTTAPEPICHGTPFLSGSWTRSDAPPKPRPRVAGIA
jgi:hypothetical protein